MYPGAHKDRDKPAAVFVDTGETLTYGELEDSSVRLAHVFHEAGLRRGDVVALLTENSLRAFEVYWAALRSGLYITAVNHNLAPEEVAYIVDDSGATALIASANKAAVAEAVLEHSDGVNLALAYGSTVSSRATTSRPSRRSSTWSPRWGSGRSMPAG